VWRSGARSTRAGTGDPALCDGGDRPDARADAARHPVERSRTGTEPLPEYGGLIGASAPPEVRTALDQFRRHVYSVTQLESYGNCPFQFFADKVLRLNGVAEMEEGLSPIERGAFSMKSSLTSTLTGEAAVSRRSRVRRGRVPGRARRPAPPRRGEAPGVECHGCLLGRRTGAHPRHKQPEGPPSGVSRARTVAVAGGAAGLFRGRLRFPGGQEHRSGLFRKEPVVAGAVALRGKVDRIDLDASGRFSIIDYKTGARLANRNDIEEGISVQIPLYLYAIEAVLGATAGRPASGCPASTIRSARRSAKSSASAARSTRKSLRGQAEVGGAPRDRHGAARAHRSDNPVRQRVCRRDRRGNFAVRPKRPDEVCSYCAYNSVCRIKTRIAIQQEGAS